MSLRETNREEAKREELRAQIAEDAAEINRLQRRVHETYKLRDMSDEAKEEWSRACAEFHARYAGLCLPGGPYPDFYVQLRAGEPQIIEVALCFLEVRPYFFRSGYHWKTILQKCKRAPMSDAQAERFRRLVEKYSEWRKLRRSSSERGVLIKRELWPLIRQFYHLFPVKLADHKFDGVITAGDLYGLLCNELKVEPLSAPETLAGIVRSPCSATPGKDMAAWSREYGAWRRAVWVPEDIWATLTSIIRDAFQLESSAAISMHATLRSLRHDKE